VNTKISQATSLFTDLATIAAQQYQIVNNDICSILKFSINILTWPFQLGLNHLSLYILAPMAITLILLSQASPPITYDLWNAPSKKTKFKYDLLVLYSRNRCMYSSLNSIYSNDSINMLFSNTIIDRQSFLENHSQPIPNLLHMPYRLIKLLKSWRHIVPAHSKLSITSIYNYIEESKVPILRYALQLLLLHFILPLYHPAPKWNDSIAHDFALTT